MSDSTPAAVVETLPTLAELQARLERRTVTAGEIVRARIVGADGEHVTVEVDGTRGTAPRDEFGDGATPGTEVELYVDDPDAEPVLFSRHKAVRLALWRWLEGLRRSGETVQATVIVDRGDDLSVDIGGIKALLPRRELGPRRSRGTGDLLGEAIDVRVMRIREKKGQVFVSERAPMMADRAELKSQTLATLEAGQLVEGEVVRLTNFGAFVDIGGTDGLLHINDMSHRRLRHPSEVVDVGDVLTVKVLRYDPDAEKISLGLKQTLPDPWLQAEARYRPGTHVTGEVVGLTKFGAFVMLPDGIEGLAHISEMAWGKSVQRPGDVVERGQQVDAWVVKVDIEQKRLGLTLRDPAENPWMALAERLHIGTRVEGTVARVADFGIFVNLDAENDLDGLVHQNDFSWGPVTRPVRELFSPGDPVEVMVLGVEPERGRATLGIKQLHADLAAELIRNYAVGQTIEGTVTSVQDFGAFVELEPGLEGLIPVSALAEGRVEHPEDVVQPGDRVTATITRVDTVERKVSLQRVIPPAEPAEPEAPAEAAEAAEPEAPAGGETAPYTAADGPADGSGARRQTDPYPAAAPAEDATPADDAAPDLAPRGQTDPFPTVTPSQAPAAAAPEADEAAQEAAGGTAEAAEGPAATPGRDGPDSGA